MATRDTAWPTGTPCWVDLVVDDLEMATQFYRELFDWDYRSAAPDDSYLMAIQDGRPVAGIGARPDGLDMPSVWTTYLATDDADGTIRLVEDAGGRAMLAPFDVPGAGRMAVAFDPTGASFGLWQAGDHLGVELVDTSGAVTWNECMTRDYQRAQDFYATVFGYTYDERGDGQTFSYALMRLDDHPIGAIGELGVNIPRQVFGHWMTYFTALDPDATAGRAVELGAVQHLGPVEVPQGRMAVLEGPHGEVFAVITPVRASSDAASTSLWDY